MDDKFDLGTFIAILDSIPIIPPQKFQPVLKHVDKNGNIIRIKSKTLSYYEMSLLANILSSACEVEVEVKNAK